MRRYGRSRSRSRYSRSSRSRRTNYRRARRSYSRNRRIPKRYNVPRVLKVTRFVNANSLIGPTVAGTPTTGFRTFRLSDVAANMRYETMYDQYRLTGIKFKFYPPVTEIQGNYQDPGFFYYVSDEDDAANPAATIDFINRTDVHKRRLIGKPFSFFFRPTAAGAAYDTSTAYNATVLPWRTWYDANDASIEFYGFKWVWYAGGGTATGMLLQYDITYYLEFKGLTSQNG